MVVVVGPGIESIKDAEGIAAGCRGNGDGIVAGAAEGKVGTGDGVVGVVVAAIKEDPTCGTLDGGGDGDVVSAIPEVVGGLFSSTDSVGVIS